MVERKDVTADGTQYDSPLGEARTESAADRPGVGAQSDDDCASARGTGRATGDDAGAELASGRVRGADHGVVGARVDDRADDRTGARGSRPSVSGWALGLQRRGATDSAGARAGQRGRPDSLRRITGRVSAGRL